MKRGMEGRPVYSTDPEFVPPCEACGEPPDRCRCKIREAPPPAEQTARIRLERKGRGGKTVTVIGDLRGPGEFLQGIARSLKEACGTGGTVKGEERAGVPRAHGPEVHGPGSSSEPRDPARKRRHRGGEEIELQGDHRDRAEEALRKQGFRVKRVGG